MTDPNRYVSAEGPSLCHARANKMQQYKHTVASRPKETAVEAPGTAGGARLAWKRPFDRDERLMLPSVVANGEWKIKAPEVGPKLVVRSEDLNCGAERTSTSCVEVSFSPMTHWLR